MLSRSTLLVLYLAALSAFPPFSTDIYLASMPIIQKLFATSALNVQLTLSLFFIGFSLGQLFWGPLSDRIGRKPALFLGVFLYVIASFLCSRANSIGMLIVMRLLQSLGAASGSVISLAIVRDSFPVERVVKVLSIMMSVLMIAPLIAPIVGSYLLVHFSWRSNFYFLTFFGAVLLLALLYLTESHPPGQRQVLNAKGLYLAYIEQLKNRNFMLAAGINAAIFCAMFAFISSSSFIYQQIYHVSPKFFGYFFAFNALGLLSGVMTINLLAKQLGSPFRITMIGVGITFFSGVVMLLAVFIFRANIYSVMLPMFAATYGAGLTMPTSTSIALSHVVKHSGLASALLGCLRFFFASVISALMGLVVTKSAFPLAWAIILLGGLGFILVLGLSSSKAAAAE